MGLRVALCIFLVSAPALGAAVSLAYEAAPQLGCPDEATLRQLVAARLGHDPFTDEADSLLTVRMRPGAAVQADIELESPRGAPPRHKSLSGADCASLLSSVAITVALTVDPLLKKAEPNAAPTVSPPPLVLQPRGPLEPLAPQAPVVEPPPPPPSFRGSLSAGASVSLGLSVVAQPTLRVEGRLQGERFSLGLEGRFGWPVTGALSQGALTTSVVLGALVPCVTWKWLSGCADVSLGALRLEGQSLAAARVATVFHASLGLRVVFSIPLGEHVALGLLAEGQAPLTRASALVGTTRVWSVSPVGGGLGALITFLL